MRLFLTILFIFFLQSLAPAQDSLYEVAERFYQEKEYQKAYQEYKKAGLAFQLTDRFERYAACNLRMAQCLLASGDVQQGVHLAKNTQQYITGELASEENLLSEALMIVGKGYLKTGRNDLALEALLQAEQNLTAYNNLKAAQCYNALGVIYWNTGNRETALSYHERALSIRRMLLPANHILLADSYLNVGLTYLDEAFLQAIIYFDRALNIYLSNPGGNQAKVALSYSNLSLAHLGLGNFKDAQNYLDLTMEIWDTSYQGDHPNKAFVISSKGSVYEKQGDYDRALLMQEQALAQYLRLYGTRHPEVANTHALIGSVQMKKKDYKNAVESYQKSVYASLFDQEYESVYDLPEIRDYFNADILLSSLQGKAQALEALHFEKSLRLKDIENAFETYKKCDLLIAKIRQLRLNEADKIRMAKLAFDVYDNGIRIALYLADKTFRKTYFRQEAFRFSERSKSAILLEAIKETKAKHFAGIPDDLIRREDSLKAEISWLEQELAKGNENTDQLKNSLFAYQQAYRTLIHQLEKDFPNYYRLKYNESTPTVENIRSKLPPGTVLLSYFVGDNSLYVFQLTGSGMEAYDYPKKKNLLQLTSGLRNGIKYRISEAFRSSAYELYDQLIPPLGKDTRQLIILPDGVLGTIPFEALLMNDPAETEENHYLVSRYAISYDYAASLYYEKASGGLPEETKGILLSAPVAFNQNEVKMPSLPGSEREVNNIRYLFLSETDKPSVFLKEKASETYVKSNLLKSYRYLHFATHGIVNETKPNLSCIFLFPDEREDGSLYSGEIYNLEINASLVTLSACETGLGKVAKGEGIIGLSRSLMYAGARNLIVSLWQVADESTAQLMIDFYRQHLRHPDMHSFANDLRQAKLSLITSEEYNEPYYWAPFILIGF